MIPSFGINDSDSRKYQRLPVLELGRLTASKITENNESTTGGGKSMESITKNDNADTMDNNKDQHKLCCPPRMSHVAHAATG